MRRLLLAAALGVTTHVGAASAQGVPVVDTQSIAQDIRQLQQMLQDFGIQSDLLDGLLEQIALIEQQLDRLRSIEASVSGLHDVLGMAMGGDLDGLLDQEVGDAIAVIAQVREGDWSGLTGDAAPRMRARMEEVLSENGFDEETLSGMAASGSAGAQRTASQASAGALLSAAAQNGHEEAAQSLERVERLVGMIGDMRTLKESVDHNTRVTAELAIALTRMWELEAIQTVGAGQAGVIDAATIAEERRYMDFTLPDLGGGE